MRRLCSSIVAVALLAAGSTIGLAAQEDPSSRPASPSSGCEVSTAVPGTARGQTMSVGEEERRWTMHVPEAHDRQTPLPLWILLHGSGSSGPGVIGLKAAADEHGFVVAAPVASPGNDRWMWWVETTELDATLSNPDIAFVDALIEHLGEELCLDLARVYATGYSAGGAGVSILGCTLADRLAAVAPVARIWDLGDACTAERPVPHRAIHGLNDDIITWDRGFGWADRANLPMVQLYDQAPIPERTTGVAVRNGCEPEPVIEISDDVWERWNWTCLEGAEVELLVHEGGHTWGPQETTDLIWEFFEQHPMPE